MRSLRPRPALGVLPSAYASTATGVFCDNPAPGPEPGGATRPLGPGPTPRTPAQTEVPLSPPLLALLLPCTPARHPRLSLESPLHPERTGGPRRPSRAQRSCQHPARPDLRTLRARPDRQRAARPSGGALRSHPPARGGQFTFVMLCQRTSQPSWSRRPSSLAYRLVLVGDGGEAGRRGAQLCNAFALGREHLSPRPFQQGRSLSGQAPTPPEWPSLPAKEQRRHTPPPRRPPLGLGWPGPQSEARRAGGKAWEPDGRRAGSPPKSGRLGWGRHPARKVLVDPPPVSGSREELGSSASGFLEPMLPACAGPSLGPAPRGQRGRRV